MAQSAHAATAVLHENADTPDVKEYLTHLQGMRKTVMEVGTAWDSSRCVVIDVRSRMKRLYGVWRRSWTGWTRGYRTTSGLSSREYRIVLLLLFTLNIRENTPTALALAPNKRPKALKAVLDAAGCQLWR